MRKALISLFSDWTVRAIPFLILLSACRVLGSGSEWFARGWRTDEGLPDNDVTGVAQSADGFLWVSTLGGLVRFDGTRFEEFSPENIDGILSRGIRTLLLDRGGRMWLSLDRGVLICVYGGSAKVFSSKDGVPNTQAQMLVQDGDGGVWLSYGGRRTLTRIKDDRGTVYGAPEGVPASGAAWITTDKKGQLWLIKDAIVSVFRDGKFHRLTNLPTSDPPRATAAKSGGIWICSGLSLWKYSEETGLEKAGQLPDGVSATALLEDQTGALWIGTAANGLYRRTAAGLETMPTSHDQIACLLEDHEGNIWAGTSGGGLDRLRPRAVELIGTEGGLPFESIRSVCEDTSGAIWVATQNGMLARKQGEDWTEVSLATNWPGGSANCVVSDPRGPVWIGTGGRGLLQYNNGEFKNWRTRNGLASDSIRGLLVSSSGDLWMAFSSAVQRMHDGKIEDIHLPSGNRYLRAMAEDAGGNIWAGTSEGRLFRITDTEVTDETEHVQGGASSIRCLYCTSDGALWIGYAGFGLGRFKGGNYFRLTTKQGLHDDFISQIVADKMDRLWLAGNGGIFQVPVKDLSNVAEGRTNRVRSVLYGRTEGLPSLQASYDAVPGATRSHDGRVWIAMRTGLAVVHTENIRDNPELPPMLIESVAVDGQPMAVYDSQSAMREPDVRNLTDLRRDKVDLPLGAHYRKLEINFTALSFTAPENVNFRYRLEGLDDTWNEAGTQRSATFDHLNPGTYRFHVIACNNSGVWNERGATLAFTVAPFFWQRLSFQAAMLGLFTLCVIAVVRYVSFRRLRLHVRELEQQTMLHKERARIAKDIHDDLGANLTQITLLSELANQDMASPEKARPQIDKISATARQVMKSLDEIVWAVNPRNDTLPHLVDYLGQFTLDFLRAPGIRCRLDLPEHPPGLNVPADIRHNVFLAVKEALNNIVKHSGAKEVRLGVDVSNGKLRIVVTDDGHGFERPPQDAWADGLRNMRQRMGEIGGECAINSRSGAGTTITFDVPWRNHT